MNQAIVDPAELRRFAQTLRRFNEDINDRAAALAAQLNSLAQTWRDKEHLKFSEDFGANMKALGRFVESNETYIPYLMKKAQLIEEYLQQQ
ncbi:MAG: WXG100 family type VII secretion target [Planctomycetaceae bacterium]